MTEKIKTAVADLEGTRIEYDDGGRMIVSDTIHLILIKDHERGTKKAYGPDRESLEEGVKVLEEADLVLFHNGIGYDLKALKKHFGFVPRDPWHCIDTLVLTKLFYSNVKQEEDFKLFDEHKNRPDTDPYKFTGKMIGKHSLEAWGLRLKSPHKKLDFAAMVADKYDDPFAQWSPEMEEYGLEDVEVLDALWTERLKKRFYDKSNREAIYVEHLVAETMEQVKETGILLDVEWAMELTDALEARQEELYQEIQKQFPPRYEPLKWVHKPIAIDTPMIEDHDLEEYNELCNDPNPEAQARCAEIEAKYENAPKQKLTVLMDTFKKNKVFRPRFNLPEGYLREEWGEVFTPKVDRVVKDKQGNVLYTAVKGSPFVKIDLVEFNPNSRPQIIRRLLELGWIPEEFTDAGNPDTSEVELIKLVDEYPQTANLAKYLLIQKRLSQIKTGDKAWLKLVSSSSFIHPTIRPCDTVAFRASHADPNISQVPSVKNADVFDADGNKVRVTRPRYEMKFNGIDWDRIEAGTEDVVKQRILYGEEGKWGYDCRRCFTVPTGFTMVGVDLAGIEMRAWAHHLWKYDGGRFADTVLNRDVHEDNRVILGFDDRRKAKEWLYACVPLRTKVKTLDGWKGPDQLQVGDPVVAYDSLSRRKVASIVEEIVKYEDADIMTITSGPFKVQCTPNHRWFTSRGVVEAVDLQPEDHIIINAPYGRTGKHQRTELPLSFKFEDEKQDVWCIKTSEGSFVMEQDGVVTITGNTMYGAGDEKLGFVIDPLANPATQKALGKSSRARFMAGLEGYSELNNSLIVGVKRGYIHGLDGRRVPVRKAHAALNALLQSDGAIISKYWIMFALDMLENEHDLNWGWDKDFTLMLYSHDELQFGVRSGLEDLVADVAEKAALKAGKHLNFRLPVEVGISKGAHWGDTH